VDLEFPNSWTYPNDFTSNGIRRKSNSTRDEISFTHRVEILRKIWNAGEPKPLQGSTFALAHFSNVYQETNDVMEKVPWTKVKAQRIDVIRSVHVGDVSGLCDARLVLGDYDMDLPTPFEKVIAFCYHISSERRAAFTLKAQPGGFQSFSHTFQALTRLFRFNLQTLL